MSAHWHAEWWLTALVVAGVLLLLIGSHIIRRMAPPRPDLPPFPPVKAGDRILILAPHEDDETLGAGGLIQQALPAGARVRVAYLTYGDHNQLAFIAYRRKPWLSPRVNQEMGGVRRAEAIAAMAYLGVPSGELAFLGFPDHDTLSIWMRHWGDSAPLHSILTDTTRVPYPSALCYGRPYKGEEILKAVEAQLLEFRPTHILVPHAVDGNPDHRAYYLFLRAALLEIGDEIPGAKVYTYPIHMGPWPRPHWFHPEDWLSFPGRIARERSSSYILELEPEQVRRKNEAIAMYRSQMSDSAYWLTAFARRNEIFTLDEPTPLEQGAGWSPIDEAFASASTAAYEQTAAPAYMAGVAYRNAPEGLVARVEVRGLLERVAGISVYAFGFRRDRPFGGMPKLRVDMSAGKPRVYDKGREIAPGSVAAEFGHGQVTYTIPWEMLGEPEAVFVQTGGSVGGIRVSYTGWRIFTL